MNNVSFMGGEAAGSIAKTGKTELSPQPRYNAVPEQAPDKVCFKGRDHDDGIPFLGSLAKLAAAAVVIIGALGYAHKANVVGKLKDGKLKDFLRKSDKITEPCHKWCSKTKEFGTKYYNKVKEFFSKKS